MKDLDSRKLASIRVRLADALEAINTAPRLTTEKDRFEALYETIRHLTAATNEAAKLAGEVFDHDEPEPVRGGKVLFHGSIDDLPDAPATQPRRRR